MSLQTQDKPEKHQQCKTMCELSSPIKLTKVVIEGSLTAKITHCPREQF